MNIKPDDKLAYIVAPFHENGVGHFVAVVRPAAEHEIFERTHFITTHPSWVCRGAVPDDMGTVLTILVIADECLRPLRGGEGNESFVVKARKTLPRKKPVTGPVTINARGEPA